MPDTEDNHIFYPHWQASFRTELALLGFGPVSTDARGEAWEGEICVGWEDPTDGAPHRAPHRVRIVLDPVFPFRKPYVLPLDADLPIRDSRHQEPGSDNGALCLWPEDTVGWMPDTTAAHLLERVRVWFVHYHRDDWPPEDRPPDLHLYFPAYSVRPLMLIGDDWKLPPGVISGRFGLWQRNAECAFAGAPVDMTRMPPVQHADRILAQIGMGSLARGAVGVWFLLKREPVPRPTLDAFLADVDAAAEAASGFALTQLRALYGNKLRDQTPLLLAVGYPGQRSEEAQGAPRQWLFLRATPPSGTRHRRWTTPGFLSQMRLESFETAPAGWEALMRRTGHTIRATGGSKILVFGQGALGSSVTLLLAKSGVTALEIVDSGRMRPGNSVRHAAGLSYVGCEKTLATKLEALNHAPDCEITCREASWDVGELTSWIWGADVIIDATANTPFSLLLNELCLREKRPVVYATAHRRATVGRIRVVRPGRDACLVCYRGYVETDDILFIPPTDEGEFVESGCGVPTVEASAADVEAVANAAARAALRLLDGKIQDDNHCFVVNEPVTDASTLLSRIGVNWSCWPPIPQCEACGSRT